MPFTYRRVRNAADADNGIREDTSYEAVAALKPPVFDRKYGSVTAGNSSPVTTVARACSS